MQSTSLMPLLPGPLRLKVVLAVRVPSMGQIELWGCPRGVMVKAMDCGIVVREFVLQSRYYVHFRANTLGKGRNLLILPSMGQIELWGCPRGTIYPTPPLGQDMTQGQFF